MIRPYSNVKAALAHPFNLIFLASSASIAGAAVDLRPGLAALALDVVYLAAAALSPEGSPLQRLIYSKPFGDIRLPGQRTPIEQVSRQSILPILSPEVKEQYVRLELHNKSILSAIGSDTAIGPSISDTLTYLLNKFLLFAVRDIELRERLEMLAGESEALDPTSDDTRRPRLKMVAAPGSPQHEEPVQSLVARAVKGYTAEIERVLLRQSMDADPKENRIQTEWVALLRRRYRHVERIGNALLNIRLEMNKIHAKIESMDKDGLSTAPSQALKDLRGLIVEADSVTRTIEEFETLEVLSKLKAA